MRVALAQLNLLVGDVAGNTARVIDTALRARDELHADLVLFPELTLTGYPPEDLLLHRGLRRQVADAERRLEAAAQGIALLWGAPEWVDGRCYNTAVLAADGAIVARYRKQALPNYAVFDEKRYFDPGDTSCVFEFGGMRCGLTVCEDMWVDGPSQQAVVAGAEILFNLSASPFQRGRQRHRETEVFGPLARSTGVPVVTVNLVGGQDELLFDGGSAVYDREGVLMARARPFQEDLVVVDCHRGDDGAVVVDAVAAPADALDDEAAIWAALVLGTRDYVEKNGFPGVVLGLSGGIDSALCATLAADALGPERVHTVMMPSRHTSAMSVEDADLLAQALGVDHHVIDIEATRASLDAALAPAFQALPADTTEQNLQARIRGTLLMALSNKRGWLVLATGNKSEYAVGYATLYGDMVGGFAPLKDTSKTWVYRLAAWRNGVEVVIPQRIIDRPPTAELAPGQLDQDTLPPYDRLDRMVELLVEQECSPEEVVSAGFDPVEVTKVVGMIRANEYKRRQAAPGVRITGRAFGRDRRYPITSGYR